MADEQQYRLVTRSDFDGLICAVLLKARDMIDEIRFAHPKDVQDGTEEITERDITTNLPYQPRAHLAIDHHSSEALRTEGKTPENLVLDPSAPSAARVVYNHLGGRPAFPGVSQDMLAAVDKADSADFTKEEVLDPQAWVLLGFLMDARTGLGRFKKFRISNYQLMMDLIDNCRDYPIDELLQQRDVAERVALYKEHQEPFRQQLERCTTMHKHLAVIDLRGEETIYVGNRFVAYALFPQASISMHVMWGLNRQNTVFAMGKSIFNRTSRTDIGALALKYGGGGHSAAGTCQVPNERAETVMQELIQQITADG